jgi:hypothetical protein
VELVDKVIPGSEKWVPLALAPGPPGLIYTKFGAVIPQSLGAFGVRRRRQFAIGRFLKL